MRSLKNVQQYASKNLVKRKKKAPESVPSDLAAKISAGGLDLSSAQAHYASFGFRPFPCEGRVVSNELINTLREADE